MNQIPDTYKPRSYTGVIDPETRRSVSAARDIGHAFTCTVLRNAMLFTQQAIVRMYKEGSADRDSRLNALTEEIRVLLEIWQAPWNKAEPEDPSGANMVGRYLERWHQFHNDLKRDPAADEVHSMLCRAVMDEFLAYLLTTPYAATGLVEPFSQEHDVMTTLYARLGSGGGRLFRRLIKRTFGQDRKHTPLAGLTSDIVNQFRAEKAEEIKKDWREDYTYKKEITE